MIVATVLTSNREAVIADAIKSVEAIVDRVVIVDLGITDRTIEIAREIMGDSRVSVRPYAIGNDFAAARNFALQCAADAGATWALTLDTDERMLFTNAEQVRQEVESTDASVLMVASAGGHYAKYRLIRPNVGQWECATHECFIQTKGVQKRLQSMTFMELPKSRETYQARCRNDIRVLLTMPKTARTYSYLGQSYIGLEEWANAHKNYAKCAQISKWTEEIGWSWYNMAVCNHALGKFVEGIETCLNGMKAVPRMAEFPWMAAWISYKAGKFANAIHYAKMAVALGDSSVRPEGTVLCGFRHIPAYYEAPWDVLRFAWKALGNKEEQEKAEAGFQAQCQIRRQRG